MTLASMIESRLCAYLAGEIALPEFDAWFASHTWDIRNRHGEATRKLAYAIELRLAEYTSGHLTESGLQEELRQLVSNPPSQPPQTIAVEKSGPK